MRRHNLASRTRPVPRLPLALVLLLALADPAAAVDPNEREERAAQQAGPDLAAIRARVKAKDWAGAERELRALAGLDGSADALNLLAFSLRNQGRHEAAFTYYFKALALDPDHKGAREYLGELYVKTGDMTKAREQLAILERLCPTGCEERDDLAEAIAGK
jgi:Flp pilus assembly protein TadD